MSGYPHSTLGSLSSIITTSIASSEPDPGAAGGGSGGGGGGGGGGGAPGSVAADAGSIAGVNGSSEEKLALNRPGIKQEKWTTILLQVSIPFFLAGIGTIGAGIVLGRVEVMYPLYTPLMYPICSINHWSRARSVADTATEWKWCLDGIRSVRRTPWNGAEENATQTGLINPHKLIHWHCANLNAKIS